MPQAVVAAIVAAAAQITIAKVVFFVASFAVSNILQGQAARRQKQADLNRRLASLKDAQVTIRGGAEPRRSVYGRLKVGGLAPFAQSSGEDKRFMYVVVVLAAHQIDAVEKIFFNEYEVTPDGSGFVTGDQFKSKKASQQLYAGAAAGLIVTLPAAPSKITAVSRVVTADGGEGYEAIAGYTAVGAVITLPAGFENASIVVNYETTTGVARAKIETFLGGSAQTASSTLIAACPSEWTANHRLRGCAYLLLKFEFDQEVYQGGVPNVTAIIRGKRVYDPRSGLVAWTRNPALIARDWRTSVLGMDLPSVAIDDYWVIAAANRSDELVEIAAGETQTRYTCDCAVDAIREASGDMMDAILETMAGGQISSGGLWRIWAGGLRVPEVRLSAADLNGPVQWTPVPPAEDLFNTVKGTFNDEERGYQEASFAQVSEKHFVAQDGAVISVEEKWPFSTNKHRVLRLDKIRIRAARGGTLNATFKVSAWQLLPGEMVYVNLPYLDLIDRLMMIESMELDGDAGTVKMQLKAMHANVWAWDYREIEVLDREVEVQFPDVSEVAPPANVVVQSGPDFAVVATDGSVTNRLRVSWSAPIDRLAVSTEVEWKLAGETAYRQGVPVLAGQNSVYLAPVQSGQHYIVRVRHRNVANISSSWEVLGHVASNDQGVPASVLQLFSDSGSNIAPGSAFKVRWVHALLADRYVVEVEADNAIRRTRVVYGNEFAYSWEDAVADGGPWRSILIKVQAANSSGVSSSKAQLSLQNLAPPAPTVQVVEGIESLVIRTARPSDTDFAGMLVWSSTTAGFTPNASNVIYNGPNIDFVMANVAGTLYFRVAHFDSFGKSLTGAGLNLSVQASGTPSPAGGIRVFSSANAPNVNAVGHPEVWYNTTLDTLFMEVNGAYIDVRDGGTLYANSIAANKLAVLSLSAISANLGTVTSGRFEVDAAGYVRGGQTGFANGTGFFMGYSGGAYKLSIGQSGGAGLTWDGARLEIRNSLNQLILSTDSGVFIPDLSVTLAKINTATIGSLSSLSANLGTITSGFIQSPDGRHYINLNATVNQPFLLARDSSLNERARINADGSTKFVNLVGSGTINGSWLLASVAGGGFDPGGND